MTLSSILTVTTAAESYDLIELATLKSDLNITNGANDAYLKRLITRASSAIREYCDRVFLQETVVETFRLPATFRDLASRGVEALMLARCPVDSITSIVLDGTTLTAADYELDADRGLIYRLSSDDDARIRWCGTKTVVTYVGGYEFADLPASVSDACSRLVKAQWFARLRDPTVKQESVPGVLDQQFWVGQIGEDGNIPPDVAALLDPYRTPSI